MFRQFIFLLPILFYVFYCFSQQWLCSIKKKRTTKHLHTTIAQTKEDLTKRQLILREQWIACKEFFAQNRPPIEHPDRFMFRAITVEPTYKSLPEQTITELADKTADTLAKRLGTDYAV